MPVEGSSNRAQKRLEQSCQLRCRTQRSKSSTTQDKTEQQTQDPGPGDKGLKQARFHCWNSKHGDLATGYLGRVTRLVRRLLIDLNWQRLGIRINQILIRNRNNDKKRLK
jgi:hypothetical protein